MRRGLVCLFVLAFASVAAADHVNVILEADPVADPCYNPGDVVKINVYYESFFEEQIGVRLLQFANYGSSCTDGFAPWDGYNPDYPEFSEWPDLPVGGAFYAKFNTWPLPSAAYTGPANHPTYALYLNYGVVTKVGSFDFTIPEVCPDPCPGNPDCPTACHIDIINVNGLDPDQTGRIRANWDDPLYDLYPANGGLTGGVIDLCCIPEPASLALLGLGMLAVLRRR